MDEEFEKLAIEASNLLDTVENYQFELGKISNEIVEKYGYKALDEFSIKIEKTGGVKRTPSSLRMYAHVWKMSNKLDLPKDILFSGCQAIIFSSDPLKYAEMVKNGTSGAEIKKIIYDED